MASPANVRHELANALIEHDGTADETVLALLDYLVTAESEWARYSLAQHVDKTFLKWLAS